MKALLAKTAQFVGTIVLLIGIGFIVFNNPGAFGKGGDDPYIPPTATPSLPTPLPYVPTDPTLEDPTPVPPTPVPPTPVPPTPVPPTPVPPTPVPPTPVPPPDLGRISPASKFVNLGETVNMSVSLRSASGPVSSYSWSETCGTISNKQGNTAAWTAGGAAGAALQFFCDITVTATGPGGSDSTTVTYTVLVVPPTPTPTPTPVLPPDLGMISPASKFVNLGETVNMSVSLRSASGPVSSYSWSETCGTISNKQGNTAAWTAGGAAGAALQFLCDITVTATGLGGSDSTTVTYTVLVVPPTSTPTPTPAVTATPVAPPKVTGLMVTRATGYDCNHVHLEWDRISKASRYIVERRTSSEQNWTPVNPIVEEDLGGVTGQTTSDHGIFPATGNQANSFRVAAHGDGKKYADKLGSWSDIKSITPTCRPKASAPRILSTTANNYTITVTWLSTSGSTHFKIEYRKSGDTTWRLAHEDHPRTSYTVRDLECNTEYEFQVAARGNGTGFSTAYGEFSPTLSGSTPVLCPPPSPIGLRVAAATRDSVSLNWNTLSGAAGYKVEYRVTGNGTSEPWENIVVDTITSATVDDLECKTRYEFQVRARGDGSPYSADYGDPSSTVLKTTEECTNVTVTVMIEADKLFPIIDGDEDDRIATLTATVDGLGDAAASVLYLWQSKTPSDPGWLEFVRQNTQIAPIRVSVPETGPRLYRLQVFNDSDLVATSESVTITGVTGFVQMGGPSGTCGTSGYRNYLMGLGRWIVVSKPPYQTEPHRAEILIRKPIPGLGADGQFTCLKGRFTSQSAGWEKLRINGFLEKREPKLPASSSGAIQSKLDSGELTGQFLLSLYELERFAQISGSETTPLQCDYCVGGYTETKPIRVLFGNLKRPEFRAVGRHFTGESNSIETYTSWFSGERSLPPVCDTSIFSSPSRSWSETVVNISFYIIRERGTEPAICKQLHKAELREEIALDLPELAHSIVDALFMDNSIEP